MLDFTPRKHITHLAEKLRSSLWGIPALLIGLAISLSYATISLDQHYGNSFGFLFRAGSEGARVTLATIAGSVMTVAGVSFSITIVVLQLSSTQFSPRVIRGFLRDRLIQTILGTYIGTFTYVLLVLRTVESAVNGRNSFVPEASLAVSIALGVVCMIMLVVFIHHVAHSIQASAIIKQIADEVRGSLSHIYPNRIGEPLHEHGFELWEDSAEATAVMVSRTGYLLYIGEETLCELSGIQRLKIERQPGDYVRRGDLLALVWPRQSPDSEPCKAVLDAFAVGDERTVRQDLRFGFRMIADIAVRALSPGINDPTTAIYCTNTLSDLLCSLIQQGIPEPSRTIADADLKIYARRPDIDELAHLSFAQIIEYGQRDIMVLKAVIDALHAMRARDHHGLIHNSIEDLSARITHVIGDKLFTPDRCHIVEQCRILQSG